MEEPPIYKATTSIPIKGKVAAGILNLYYEVDYGRYVPENSKADYALFADGNSMEPVIRNGEIIEIIQQIIWKMEKLELSK